MNSIDIASFPGQFLIACSKQKRTGGVEGLGTRLTSVGCRAVNYGELNRVLPLLQNERKQNQSWATLPGKPLACVKYKPAPPNSGYATKAYRSVKEQPVPVEGTVKGKVANMDSEISIFVMGPTCKNGTVSGVPGLLLQGGGRV